MKKIKNMCNLLKQGHPMIDLKDFKVFFQNLKVDYYPDKHWSNSTCWMMVATMHNIILCKSL
jgi:hypothetical protein